MKRRILLILCCCLAFIAIAFRVPFFPLFAVSLPDSMNYMEPLLHGGDIAFVHRFAYRDVLPNTGDIIVFQSPDRGPLYIGEGILCKEDLKTGSGLYAEWFTQSLDAKAICIRKTNPDAPSQDWLNPIPLTAVRGRVVFVCWPPSSWGKVKSG